MTEEENQNELQVEEEASEETEVIEVEKVSTGKPDLDAKTKSILESKLPEKAKKDYLVRLGVIEEEKQTGVPFQIWAKVRRIPKNLHEAMRVSPQAKGIKLAEMKQWDEIFKKF